MSAPVFCLPQADSTNAWAKAHPDRAPGVWAVYTLDQTAGRGRLGRAWAGAAGQALYYTVTLPLPPAALPTLPLFAGLAVCDALQARYGVQARIKWPNDVLLGGKKLAGILCEAAPAGVICGIGINLAQPAAYFAANGLPHATSLAVQGVPVAMETDPAALAKALTHAFAEAAPALARDGFAAYLARYKALCLNLGRRVQWEGGAGTVLDVDAEGRLVVQDAQNGKHLVFTGEVSIQGIYGAV